MGNPLYWQRQGPLTRHPETDYMLLHEEGFE
jgi:hypothetical protein